MEQRLEAWGGWGEERGVACYSEEGSSHGITARVRRRAAPEAEERDGGWIGSVFGWNFDGFGLGWRSLFSCVGLIMFGQVALAVSSAVERIC